MRKINKLGHQAPKGINRFGMNNRVNNFNSINISSMYNDNHFEFCKKFNFVYNSGLEEEKLYNAQPCIYTDKLYVDEDVFHLYGDCYLNHRGKYQSLKACIRTVNKCKNIPKGTIVEFGKSYYYPKLNIDNGYLYKVKKENKFTPKYEINLDIYSNNFTTCEKSKDLTNLLRKNGFIVAVYNSNPNRLIGEEDGEIAIAFGFNKKIGFSSERNNYQGYSNGCDNVLFDEYGYFDKWSRCEHVSKDLSNEEIVTYLKQPFSYEE